jgi:hypothetical protein
MKKILIAALFSGFALQGYAQDFLDLKRYSTIRQFGTARSMGMGGAVGATGVDFSVSLINPASLAQIRTSQISGTLGLNFTGNHADYMNNNVVDSRFNFSIPNFGVVLSEVLMERGKEKKTGLVSYSVGFGFNRVNDFNRNLTIDAFNPNSSYLDYLAEQANKYVNWDNTANNFVPFYPEELALAANAIVYNSNNTFEANLPATVTMHQNYRYQQSGRQADWNLSWAGNFSNRVYFGFGLGVPGIRFNSTETITENSIGPTVNPAVSFEHSKLVSTSGTGINGKMGLTFRAADWLRIGAAYHTPTSYSLTDQYSYTFLSRNFQDGQFVYTSGDLLASEQGNFKYKFTTPGKTVFSAAFIFKKIAMLAVDYEYVNYQQAQSSTTDLIFINSLVRNNLQAASNIRVGGEYNYLDYRFRAGFATYASPYNRNILEQVKKNISALNVYSIGAGYQAAGNPIFFDVAILFETYRDTYTPYRLEEPNHRSYETSLNTVNTTRIMFTLGSKF